ncbi:hypothetical protein AB0I84_43620 [Streptomyces spectabilis]|uniref:hypothetical protein n=1 Tax=Streptomyces spectabilis TaxID=68270 RepID=UPI00340FE977
MGWIDREYLPAVALGRDLPGRYPAWIYQRLVQLSERRLRRDLLNRLASGLVRLREAHGGDVHQLRGPGHEHGDRPHR